jgi:hypothetical protein
MTTDLDLELLRELIPEQDGPAPETRRRARAALLAEIQRGRPPRRRFRLSLGVAAAAAIAGTAVVVALVAPRGGVVRPERAAAALLQRAAVAADSARAPRPGEYWYVHSREIRLGIAFGQTAHPLEIVNARRARDRQVWSGRGVPGRLVERAIGPIEFLTAQARERWVRAGRPHQLDARIDSPLPADPLSTLPTDVGALRRVIAARDGTGSPDEVLTAIGDLLREQPVPPRVRASLFRIAAGIPGIRLIGRTRDGIGRPALDVALAAHGERTELLFDPRTAALLGERYTVLKPGPKYHVQPGTVQDDTTYISSGIVGRIGRRASF